MADEDNELEGLEGRELALAIIDLIIKLDKGKRFKEFKVFDLTQEGAAGTGLVTDIIKPEVDEFGSHVSHRERVL